MGVKGRGVQRRDGCTRASPPVVLEKLFLLDTATR
jgi:hypothetical protein